VRKTFFAFVKVRRSIIIFEARDAFFEACLQKYNIFVRKFLEKKRTFSADF